VLGDRVRPAVLLNLVLNGMDAMTGMGEEERLLEWRVPSHWTAGPPPRFASGTGAWRANVEMDRLFEAFYTTKPNGMGMGLTISRSIIEASGRIGRADPGPARPSLSRCSGGGRHAS
jgi:C4-dicarboxylate-specific signal transduction histidine kinase